jgi:hypothetical protein
MMFSKEDKEAFPRPKPDNSPSKKAATISKHEAQVAPLREKRANRTRKGGSWRLIGGKLVPNEDDCRKGKPVEEEKKPVEDDPPK